MSTHLHAIARAASICAALLVAAPAAHAQMYRWVDRDGAVTFSNQLPRDLSGVNDLTVVLENPGTPQVSAKPAQPESAPAGASTRAAEPRTVGSVLDEFNRNAAAGSAAEESQSSAAVPSNAPEAVRDPCLRSADPRCIERHKAAYVPYLGYSPEAARGTGSTAGAGASGTLAGGSRSGPGKLTVPKSSQYALPPGNELPLPQTARR